MLFTLLLWSAPLFLSIYLYNAYTQLPPSIPGPIPAKFTNLYRFFSVYRRRPEEEHGNARKPAWLYSVYGYL